MLCILAGSALLLSLSEGDFSLAWQHSVTHDLWREEWHAGPDGLKLLAAEVKGPGAGLEIPEDAIRTAEGWRFQPKLPPLPQLHLAASGASSGGWQICQAGACHALGEKPGPAILLEWRDSACQ